MKNESSLLCFSYVIADYLYIDDVFKEIFNIKNISNQELQKLMLDSDDYLVTPNKKVIRFSKYTDLNTAFHDLGFEGCFVATLKTSKTDR